LGKKRNELRARDKQFQGFQQPDVLNKHLVYSFICCYVIPLKLNRIKSVMDECMRPVEGIRLSCRRSDLSMIGSEMPE
jgi:hypothetical protein